MDYDRIRDPFDEYIPNRYGRYYYRYGWQYYSLEFGGVKFERSNRDDWHDPNLHRQNPKVKGNLKNDVVDCFKFIFFGSYPII